MIKYTNFPRLRRRTAVGLGLIAQSLQFLASSSNPDPPDPFRSDPQTPRILEFCPRPFKIPYLGDPRFFDALTEVTRSKGSASLFVLVPPRRPRYSHSELISGPPDLILFFPAAQDENLSIKVRGLWKTCYQSTTKPLRIGVLDPPPHHPSYIERAIRVWGR